MSIGAFEAIVKNAGPRTSTALFLQYNTQLGPPYHVLLDTNFINFSIQNKLDIVKSMMDCLYAKCIPYITDCVLGELEKLGPKYRLALKVTKDPRFQRLVCLHDGTYADDCLVQRVTQFKCYIVATCDKDLKRRIRKIPGVPIMYISRHRYILFYVLRLTTDVLEYCYPHPFVPRNLQINFLKEVTSYR
ncbi:unnamed protein product [Soboliphyme baturini]|uniref:rRNA-processing protein FCF1 homolog n=1 Tax=Soboliphyme baturini TaxID=241478 RepID=A0A183J3F4_9BILA|nr:unnamed protein product [Soboliphyme baturini]